MKESLAKLDKKLIFRETFTDEQSVRANGGVPSNVVFNKGIATITGTSTRLTLPTLRSSNFSFRIKFKLITVKAQSFLCGVFTVGNYEWIGIGSTGSNKITISNKANAFTSSVMSLVANKWYDVIITANSTETKIYIDGILNQTGAAFVGRSTFNQMNYIPGQSGFDMNTNVDFLEFYEGTLTAEEVKNLYQNKRYKKLAPHGEILGAELITNVADRTFSSDTGNWIRGSGFTITNGVLTGTSVAAGINSRINISMIAGKYYKLTYTVIFNSGAIQPLFGGVTYASNGVQQSISGTYTNYVTADAASLYFRAQGGFDGTIDNVSIKEVISKAELILDVDALDGVIKNRLSNGLTGANFSYLAPYQYSSPLLSVNQIIDNDGTYYNLVNTGSEPRFAITNSIFTTGKTYRCKLRFRASSAITLYYYNTSAYIPIGVSTSEWQILNIDIPIYVNMILFMFTSNTTDIDIQFLNVKEIIPSITNTAVTVVNDGGVKAMRFNGTSSKLDCGSYNGLVGDITLSVWMKLNTLSNATVYGGIVTQQYFELLINSNSKNVQVTSNGYGTTSRMTTDILLNKRSTWINVVVTRKSNGATNFYLNSVNVSAFPDITSGTPVAGTGAILIGNSPSNYRVNGNIAQVQIFNGILSQQEISALWTANKGYYNL